jgi:hypothetical protein
MRKNIDLPKETVDLLTRVAKKNRTRFKPFVELILIDKAKKYYRTIKPTNKK